jgi:hypothetical protein
MTSRNQAGSVPLSVPSGPSRIPHMGSGIPDDAGALQCGFHDRSSFAPLPNAEYLARSRQLTDELTGAKTMTGPSG